VHLLVLTIKLFVNVLICLLLVKIFKFFYQQMHFFYLTYKILIIKIYFKTLFYSHFYMFRYVRTETCRSDCKKVF